MYNGTQLWDRLVPLQMEAFVCGGKAYDAYAGIPSNLYAALKKSAAAYPDKTAIVDDDGTEISYRHFLELTDRFAGYLQRELAIKKGDHIALMLYSGGAFCVSFLASVKLGAVALTLPSKFRREEVLALLEKSDPALIICDEDFAEWMTPFAARSCKLIKTKHLAAFLEKFGNVEPAESAAAQGGGPLDPVILMYTSGTTSLSKGVLLSNFNVMHAVETYRLLLNVTPEDRTVIGVPIYHVTGLIALLSLFLYAGGTTYLHKRFDARRILQCVIRDKITFMHASPTAYTLLLKERAAFPSLPSLRMLACGSSYMPAEKILAIHEWLPEVDFRTVYGMTETSSPATVFPCSTAESEYICSCGMPVPGLLVRIVDENGAEVPDGEAGEVQMKGSVILQEYYHLHTSELTEDGWLSTGDIGYFNDAGYLFLSDRKKDMINRGGEKICSYDVEYELYRFPGVEEAAVVGIPDYVYGEVPAAAIVWKQGVPELDEETLRARLLEKMARYKVPVRVLSVERLPVTPNGKIDKKQVRDWFNQKEQR